MGKTILTTKQLDFLELAQLQPAIVKNFYLTGGTALSAFYLKHRLSEDIDLFCEKQEVRPQAVEPFLKKISINLGIDSITKEQFLGLYTYNLHYRDGETLKIDFNYYPFPRIEKGVFFKKMEISSVYDIAVNKVHTISMRPRARDYIDLYFIFQNTEYSPEKYLQRMRIDSQAKFDWPLEPKTLLVALTRVKDFRQKQALPKMLLPFSWEKMEKFFLVLAKKLENEVFI